LIDSIVRLTDSCAASCACGARLVAQSGKERSRERAHREVFSVWGYRSDVAHRSDARGTAQPQLTGRQLASWAPEVQVYVLYSPERTHGCGVLPFRRDFSMLSDLCTRKSKSCACHSVQLTRHQDRGNGRTRGDETDQGAPVQCACHSCVSRMYASVSRDGGLGMALVLVRHSLLMDGLIDEHVYCNMQVGARTVQL